jgi:thiol-disulfide isomerase/thioredoxin
VASDECAPGEAATGLDAVRPGRPLTVWIVLSASIFSLAIALFVAWFVVVRPEQARQPETISVDRFLAGSANGATQGADAAVREGAKVPNVVFERLDGSGAISLAGLAGRPTVVNFWASTCTPCLREMPLLERLHQEYGDRVSFLGVDTSEGADAGRVMVERTGVTYDQASDPQGEHVTHFGATQLPNTVVITADGTVKEIHNRAYGDEAELRRSINAALDTSK